MKKRFMSMMLSVVIAVSLLPVPVFAEEQGETKAVTTANEIADVPEESDDTIELSDEEEDFDEETDDFEISTEDADDNSQSADGASEHIGNETENSSDEPAVINDAIKLYSADTVTNLKQTDDYTTSVDISFTGVSGASGYYVYYSTDNSTYKRINGASSSNMYPDTYSESAYIYNLSAGTKYYIKVSPATYKSSTGKYTEGEKSSALQVVTAPKNVSGLKQTAATKSSATISWSSVSGATGYYVRDDYGNKVKTISSAKAKISMSSGSYDSYNVSAYLKSSSGYIAEGDDKYIYVCSAPGKPSKVASVSEDNLSWNLSNNKVTVWWDKNEKDEYYPDGYQVQIYTISGKTKLKTYNLTNGYKSFKLSKVKNKGFKIRVRAYAKNNGKKYYGPWTSKKAVVPLAKVTSFDQKGRTSATVRWKKVKNATKYSIYVCKNLSVKNPTWKKVATVSKKKTSYTIKKLTRNRSVGVYVVPTVKAGSKKYTATRPAYDYDSTYISRY